MDLVVDKLLLCTEARFRLPLNNAVLNNAKQQRETMTQEKRKRYK